MPEVILTQDNFAQEVEQSAVPVLVDFWAPWCGPCRIQGPIVKELAKEYEGKNVKIAKLNVDEAREISQKYGILSIPTLMIFKDGKPHDQMVGLHTKPMLTEKLNAVIS